MFVFYQCSEFFSGSVLRLHSWKFLECSRDLMVLEKPNLFFFFFFVESHNFVVNGYSMCKLLVLRVYM